MEQLPELLRPKNWPLNFQLFFRVDHVPPLTSEALVRSDGCGRYSLPVFPEGTKDARASAYLATWGQDVPHVC